LLSTKSAAGSRHGECARLHPPEHTVVICIDEKTGIQQVLSGHDGMRAGPDPAAGRTDRNPSECSSKVKVVDEP
jgi:hypothetical protein